MMSVFLPHPKQWNENVFGLYIKLGESSRCQQHKAFLLTESYLSSFNSSAIISAFLSPSLLFAFNIFSLSTKISLYLLFFRFYFRNIRDGYINFCCRSLRNLEGNSNIREFLLRCFLPSRVLHLSYFH